MKHLLWVFACFCLFSLFACQRTGTMLAEIDSLADTDADSAAVLFSSLPQPEHMNDADRAAYSLLRTKLRDKQREPWETDSLINYALTYYTTQGDARKIAECYYYKGRMDFDATRYTQAAHWYKEAEDWAVADKNTLLLAKIYSNLGRINFKLNVFDKALQYYKKTLNLDIMSSNSRFILNDFSDIGRSFVFLNEMDSAEYYFLQALAYIDKVQLGTQAMIYHNLGFFYSNWGRMDEASHYIRLSIEKRPDETKKHMSYGVLGNLFYEKGQKDSAHYYWNKSLESSNPAVRECTYRYLYESYYKEANYKEAITYVKLYLQYTDSVYRSKLGQEVADIQEKYDNETLRRKHLEAELTVLRQWVVGALFAIAVVILFFVYRRWQQRQRLVLAELIFHKEQELSLLRENVYLLQEYESNHAALQQQCITLKAQIGDKERELKALQRGDQLRQQGTEDRLEKSIVNGLNLSVRINTWINTAELQQKSLNLSAANIFDLISYYQVADKGFIEKLRKTFASLTLNDLLVCVLFRSGLTHQQVACVLGNTPESLSRTKTRIKSRMLLPDSRTLEEIVVLL